MACSLDSGRWDHQRTLLDQFAILDLSQKVILGKDWDFVYTDASSLGGSVKANPTSEIGRIRPTVRVIGIAAASMLGCRV